MIERDEMAAMHELRIGVHVGAVLHLMSGIAVRLQRDWMAARSSFRLQTPIDESIASRCTRRPAADA